MFDNDITFFAFRYCLGRATYAVGICVDYIIKHWEQFDQLTQSQILGEIEEAKKQGHAGHLIDVCEWNRVVEHAGKLTPSNSTGLKQGE